MFVLSCKYRKNLNRREKSVPRLKRCEGRIAVEEITRGERRESFTFSSFPKKKKIEEGWNRKKGGLAIA